MAFTAKLIAFLSFALASTWLYYSPGFDSGVAATGTLAAFFASFFIKKKTTQPSQSQNVSGGSQGIQSGRDIHISRESND